MAIDWASDHFVRLFTRETEDDLLLSWEARAVWHELLKKFDKRGFLPTKRGARGVAALVRIPVEVVERVLPELLEDGRLRSEQGGYYAPNYHPANYTQRSATARKAAERTRTQIGPLPVEVAASAECESGESGEYESQGESSNQDYKLSRGVTRSHAVSPISDQDQGRSGSVHAQGRARSARSGAGRSPISPDWQPADSERQMASDLGLDVDVEAREFVAYWLGEGKSKHDWNQTFRARLVKRGEFAKRHKPADALGDHPAGNDF